MKEANRRKPNKYITAHRFEENYPFDPINKSLACGSTLFPLSVHSFYDLSRIELSLARVMPNEL